MDANIAARSVEIARLFHDTYERLAPQFGYETRKDTKQFDPVSPNGKLMSAVCGEVVAQLEAERARLSAELAEMTEMENIANGLNRHANELLMEARAQLATQEAEIARLRADAERYRWIRNHEHMKTAAFWLLPTTATQTENPEQFDAAVDTARREQALERMAENAQELGLYDEVPAKGV